MKRARRAARRAVDCAEGALIFVAVWAAVGGLRLVLWLDRNLGWSTKA